MADLVISDLGVGVLQFAAMGLGPVWIMRPSLRRLFRTNGLPPARRTISVKRASLGLAAESVTP